MPHFDRFFGRRSFGPVRGCGPAWPRGGFPANIFLKRLRPRQWRFRYALWRAGPAGLPAKLGKLPNLTPGDFAAVRRKAAILGALGDAAEVARLLVAASKVKPGRAATIGFMRCDQRS